MGKQLLVPVSRQCCVLYTILISLITISLLTVGHTVDEAAFLFASLDHACHSQLMADAAAASGVPKKIIPHEVAQFTADAVQNPVSWMRQGEETWLIDSDLT